MFQIQNAVQTLAVVVAIIFFSNKVLVLIGYKIGWFLGMTGALLATVYLYLLGFYAYAILEIGLIFLMGARYFTDGNVVIEKWIRWVVISSTILAGIYAFTGVITIWEIIASLSMLAGTYCISNKLYKRLGWFLYFITHGITAWLSYQKNQQFFGDLQIASAIIAFIGYFPKRFLKK